MSHTHTCINWYVVLHSITMETTSSQLDFQLIAFLCLKESEFFACLFDSFYFVVRTHCTNIMLWQYGSGMIRYEIPLKHFRLSWKFTLPLLWSPLDKLYMFSLKCSRIILLVSGQWSVVIFRYVYFILKIFA